MSNKFAPKKMKTCPKCGKEYVPRAGSANMCYECRELVCQNPKCGKSFTVKPYRTGNAKYCTVKCHKQHMSDQGLIVVMNEEDEKFIVDNYEKLTAQQLADELGVTRRAITYKLEMFTKSGRITRTKRPRRSPGRSKETLTEEAISVDHLSTNLQSHSELIPSELDGLSSSNTLGEGADEGIEDSSGGNLQDDDSNLL